MRYLSGLLLLVVFLTSCATQQFYIVRHAEKATTSAGMSADVPLTPAGKERAEALKVRLAGTKIRSIYSTNTLRTRSTAEPLSTLLHLPITTYEARDTAFVTGLKAHSRGNVLIVGHSNTVDDLVNRFVPAARLTDLPETEFGDLFIVTKKGKQYSFTRSHFGN